MVAWGPAIRTAVKVAPVAIEVARQLDRQIRPHVLAYRAAREVDGYVGRWTDDEGTHWLVFADRDADPVRAFPPLSAEQASVAERDFDRSTLQHHSRLPEARAREVAGRIGDASTRAAQRARRRPPRPPGAQRPRPELPG